MTKKKAIAAAPPVVQLGQRGLATIGRIKDATRDVFLSSGYAGTTVDEIAIKALISRATFYTYFPSKREVLLAIGAESTAECTKAIDGLKTVGPTLMALELWVAEYFLILDVHGSFAFAWTQAARHDETIRTAGMKSHLAMCQRLGTRLAALVNTPHPDPLTLGLSVLSLMDRSWDFVRLYSDKVDRSAIEAQTARMIWGAIRPVSASVRRTT